MERVWEGCPEPGKNSRNERTSSRNHREITSRSQASAWPGAGLGGEITEKLQEHHKTRSGQGMAAQITEIIAIIIHILIPNESMLSDGVARIAVKASIACLFILHNVSGCVHALCFGFEFWTASRAFSASLALVITASRVSGCISVYVGVSVSLHARWSVRLYV